MTDINGLLVAKATGEIHLLPRMANRHGLVAGATGTGKTVTLQVLAEGFCRIGVPVFAADVKGDLSGICQAGGGNPKVDERVGELGLDRWAMHDAVPVMFWDVFGEQGHPMRATVSEMGPLLLVAPARPQRRAGRRAQRRLPRRRRRRPAAARPRRTCARCSSTSARTPQSCSASTATSRPPASARSSASCWRSRQQGGDKFFGEPALDLVDLMRTDPNGRGYHQHPRRRQAHAVAAALRHVPAVAALGAVRAAARGGRPRQAQARVLLRRGAPALRRRAAPRCSRRSSRSCGSIRSKGVGVYFVTQNPHRHPRRRCSASSATRSSTRCAPSRRATRRPSTAMAETFRPTRRSTSRPPSPSSASARRSCRSSRPTAPRTRRARVDRAAARPHRPATAEERAAVVRSSVLFGHYEQLVDRQSAEEMLEARAAAVIAAPVRASGTRGDPRRRTRCG